MAQCISQHNFMPDLDKDLEVGSFNFVFSGQHSIYYSLFLSPKIFSLITYTPFSFPNAYKMGQN